MRSIHRFLKQDKYLKGMNKQQLEDFFEKKGSVLQYATPKTLNENKEEVKKVDVNDINKDCEDVENEPVTQSNSSDLLMSIEKSGLDSGVTSVSKEIGIAKEKKKKKKHFI